MFGQLSGMCGQNRRLMPAAVTGRCYSSSVVEDGFCLITTDSPHVWRWARRFLFLQLWFFQHSSELWKFLGREGFLFSALRGSSATPLTTRYLIRTKISGLCDTQHHFSPVVTTSQLASLGSHRKARSSVWREWESGQHREPHLPSAAVLCVAAQLLWFKESKAGPKFTRHIL